MARPFCRRKIGFLPGVRYFKPAGIEMRSLEEVTLHLDEIEALRLTDLEGLYQEEAASRMGISRPTFSRISAEARWKVADALVNGKALRVEGGEEMSIGEDRMIEQNEEKRETLSSPEPENGGCGLGRKRRLRRRRRDGSGRGRCRNQAPIQVEVDQRSNDFEE
jgi:predicted DNA-binding protein (UPF0251 family)